ncbi:MAG: hypothetical protein VB067_13580, partial [Christensenellaceae bacterium]|nr:hypothetical protein [Christensenellaceae bacterium]
MSAISKALGPVRRRLRAVRALKASDIALAVGATLGFIIWLIAWLFFWPQARLWMIVVFIASALAPLIAYLWPVPPARAARAADGCGLNERVQTALEYPSGEPIHALQHADALKALSALDPREKMPHKPMRAAQIVSSCALLAMSVFSFIPGPQQARMSEYDALKHTLNAQAEAIERT